MKDVAIDVGYVDEDDDGNQGRMPSALTYQPVLHAEGQGYGTNNTASTAPQAYDPTSWLELGNISSRDLVDDPPKRDFSR